MDVEHPGQQPRVQSSACAHGSSVLCWSMRLPNTTDLTLTYPYGSRPGAQAWIAAGNETFVAQILGTPKGNNWFAYPARFLGCTP
jgi:hypothetical protein